MDVDCEGGLKKLLSLVLSGLYGSSAGRREGSRWLQGKKVEGSMGMLWVG